MIGDRLKRFADTLPQDEKEALYALCEPNWDYEVVGIKKGEDGTKIIKKLGYGAKQLIFDKSFLKKQVKAILYLQSLV